MTFVQWQQRLKELQVLSEQIARMRDTAERDLALAASHLGDMDRALKQTKRDLMAHCFTQPGEDS